VMIRKAWLTVSPKRKMITEAFGSCPRFRSNAKYHGPGMTRPLEVCGRNIRVLSTRTCSSSTPPPFHGEEMRIEDLFARRGASAPLVF
jgi:hypothetical protein